MLIDPQSSARLVDARLALHWAAQLPAAAGAARLPAADDWSHTALTWRDGSLHSAVLDTEVALEVEPFSLRCGADHLPLAGRTMAQALGWLGERLELGLHLLPHELPEHPVADGAPFADPDPVHLSAIATWYALADSVVRELVQGREGASPVRCWPHHFDLASLIDRGEGRTVGVGMSPGDGSYPWPYFYVTPWPYPPADQLSPLSRGARWHTEGWTGAVLSGPDVPQEGQRQAILAAVREPLEACLAT